MRPYEAIYILDPMLEEEQLTALVERFRTLIGNQGGEVLHVDRWERRRLAYEVKGRREGYYVVMNFRGTPAVEAELSRVMRISDGVIRQMVLLMDERKADKTIAEARAQAEAKAKAAAEAEAAAAAQAAAQPAPVAAAPAAPAETTAAQPAAEPAAATPATEAGADTGAATDGTGDTETGTENTVTGTEE